MFCQCLCPAHKALPSPCIIPGQGCALWSGSISPSPHLCCPHRERGEWGLRPNTLYLGQNCLVRTALPLLPSTLAPISLQDTHLLCISVECAKMWVMGAKRKGKIILPRIVNKELLIKEIIWARFYKLDLRGRCYEEDVAGKDFKPEDTKLRSAFSLLFAITHGCVFCLQCLHQPYPIGEYHHWRSRHKSDSSLRSPPVHSCNMV